MNRSQASRQTRTVAGYFLPQLRAFEDVQLLRRRGHGGGGVDHLQRGGDGFAVTVGHEPQRRPDQVHGAGLHDRVRPGRLDRLREAGQPVAAGDQHVADAAVGELGAHPGPELRPLAGLHPDAQHVLHPVGVDPDRDVGGLVADLVAVADLHHQRVEVDDRIDRLQRPRLPRLHLRGDRLGDVGDRLVGQLGAERGQQMMLDVADRHPLRIQAR